MPNKQPTILLITILVALFGFVTSPPFASATGKEKVLYRFCSQPGCTDGARPLSSLISDADGNLYGTTAYGPVEGSECGGNRGCGTIFELQPTAKGVWTETVLHTFCTTMNCPDGSGPTGALVFDSAGNLYGTTGGGGANGLGTVFQLSPNGDGTWTESVLHSFQGGPTDGYLPISPLVFDAAGNLYGTTVLGGSSSACGFGCGAVFELTPSLSGDWTEKILYSFCADGSCSTLVQPSSLTLDEAGNLYGTTNQGGPKAYGTVFRLSPHADGTWKYKILHGFNHNGTDGYSPRSGVTLDAAGHLYGTTYYGGKGATGRVCQDTGCGTVYELIAGKNDKWTERILIHFGPVQRHSKKAAFPVAGVILDAAGNLYGTATAGGTFGTVFKLTHGTWALTQLHNFIGVNNGDGDTPTTGLVFSRSQNKLYGTTEKGGNRCDYEYSDGCGVAYQVTP